MVRVSSLERGAVLREVWEPENQGSPQRQANAILVHGLPWLFQRPNRNRHRQVQRSSAQVGHCYLSLPY